MRLLPNIFFDSPTLIFNLPLIFSVAFQPGHGDAPAVLWQAPGAGRAADILRETRSFSIKTCCIRADFKE